MKILVKKIKDISYNELPNVWVTLLSVSPALMCLLNCHTEEEFEKSKQTIPTDILEKEINIEIK